MNITFRKARPEDAAAAVPLIYASGSAAFEYVFKVSTEKDAKAFLKYAFVRPGCEFSFTNHTCLVSNNQEIVGIGSAFSSDVTTGFTISAVKYIFSFYGFWKGMKVLKNGLNIEKIIAPPKGNTEVLAHLGIRSDYRNQGLGSRLVDYFIKEAQKKGRTTVSLDVSVENPRALALYQRLGFKITKENISNISNYKNKFSYVANHYKMHKDI